MCNGPGIDCWRKARLCEMKKGNIISYGGPQELPRRLSHVHRSALLQALVVILVTIVETCEHLELLLSPSTTDPLFKVYTICQMDPTVPYRPVLLNGCRSIFKHP